MDNITASTIAANLEKNFDDQADRMGVQPSSEHPLVLNITTEDNPIPQSFTLERVASKEITGDFGTATKCLAFRDQNGNLYVHFRGTGDGFWMYNTQAYDGEISKVQEECLEFFDSLMEAYDGTGEVYVTGHAQAGNTAQ